MKAKECVLCTQRTLYECNHAKVHDTRIYCDRGHNLSKVSRDGNVSINRLASGMPLVLAVCQDCADFDRIGTPVPENEKGWLKHNSYEVDK